MNTGFFRKLPNSVFSNIFSRNHIFYSLPKTTPNQNRRIVVVFGPSHPQYSTYLANRTPASICSRISNSCITVFAGYLSAKLAYGIFNELSVYITETTRLVKRSICFRFPQAYGSSAILYGQYFAAKFVINLEKVLYPSSQVKLIPPKFNSPEALNNCVNENIDSSKRQSVNNNNNNNNNNSCINSSFFVYFPKITGRLFSLRNRPLILPHINPNSYTTPLAIHYNKQIPDLPSGLTHTESVTPKNPVYGSLEDLVKSCLEKGNLSRKHGNFQESCRHFETAAKYGSANAMYNLGLMYCGKGGEEYDKRGMLYMESASNLGHAKATFMLGQLNSKLKLMQMRDDKIYTS